VYSINFDGTKNVVDAAYLYGAKVVYISTNAVFSGDSPPYDETSAMRPVNNYGLIKMRAEMYTATMAKKWLVIRPFLLYGWPNTGGRNNWVNAIVESLKRENNFSLVDDVIWQPTYALDCAETIWKLLDHDNEIFNVASPESATLYEFGLHICDAFELDKNLLKAVSSAAFEGMAARPKNTTYDLLKLSQAGVMLPDIKTGLEKMKNEL
jgi:dTDP-4-dehydrorhamnose reductase